MRVGLRIDADGCAGARLVIWALRPTKDVPRESPGSQAGWTSAQAGGSWGVGGAGRVSHMPRVWAAAEGMVRSRQAADERISGAYCVTFERPAGVGLLVSRETPLWGRTRTGGSAARVERQPLSAGAATSVPAPLARPLVCGRTDPSCAAPVRTSQCHNPPAGHRRLLAVGLGMPVADVGEVQSGVAADDRDDTEGTGGLADAKT